MPIDLQDTNAPITRRAALQTGAAVMAGAALPRSLAAADSGEKNLKRGFIDAHVHVWTPDTAAYPLAPGFKKENMKPASFTPEELLSLARPCGVTRIVLIQMSFYRYDNSYMLETIERFPGVFSGVGIVDQDDEPVSGMKRLAKGGVRGFRIRPGKPAAADWLDSAGMAAMWKYAAEANLAMCPLINPDCLPTVNAMCRRHPQTQVVIDHFARIGIDGEVRQSDLDALCGLAKHKQVAVKLSAFYALGKKKAPYTDLEPMIRRLLDAFGSRRLMWATDCPFQVQNGHTYQESIDLIRDRLELSQDDREHLLRNTAERIFFA